eukprot:gene20378-22387_t
MNRKNKEQQALNFRNFSPFYERALAEGKRDEKILKLTAKDIERRKMIVFAELSSAQRLVAKDLHQLRQAKKKGREEMIMRRTRSYTDLSSLSSKCDENNNTAKGKCCSNGDQSDDALRDLVLPLITKNDKHVDRRYRAASSGNSSLRSKRPLRFSLQESEEVRNHYMKNYSRFENASPVVRSKQRSQSMIQPGQHGNSCSTSTLKTEKTYDVDFARI